MQHTCIRLIASLGPNDHNIIVFFDRAKLYNRKRRLEKIQMKKTLVEFNL